MNSTPELECKRMTSSVTVAACFGAAAMLLASCGSDKGNVKAAGPSEAPAVSVVVAPVVQKTVPLFTELTARTDATESVDVRARVKAFLQGQNYTEGTIVKSGQVLFTLDKREYEAQLMQAQAQLARAEADLAQATEKSTVDVAQANLQIAMAQLNKTDQDVNRLKPLAALKAVPQQDYDNALALQQAARADVEARTAALNTTKVNQNASILTAKAAVEAANANIRQAQLNVEYCTVTSPITGIAGIRQVAPGNLVGASDATLLTTVSNVHPMRVYVSISEREYLMYQRMRAEGKARGAGDLQLILADGSIFPEKGRIIIADRAVDLKTGTLSLVAEFPNPKAVLRPGQFGRVRLAATVAENALLVPQKAVTQMQSANVVYVVGSNNKVALRTITLGDRVGMDQYIVTDGLKMGERVIVEGIQKARPGSTVNATDRPLTSETGKQGA